MRTASLATAATAAAVALAASSNGANAISLSTLKELKDVNPADARVTVSKCPALQPFDAVSKKSLGDESWAPGKVVRSQVASFKSSADQGAASWQSSKGGKRLELARHAFVSASAGSAPSLKVKVNASARGQSIKGFGGALTGAVAAVLSNFSACSKQDATSHLLNLYFGAEGELYLRKMASLP